jgi:hypothetical protein
MLLVFFGCAMVYAVVTTLLLILIRQVSAEESRRDIMGELPPREYWLWYVAAIGWPIALVMVVLKKIYDNLNP